MLKKTFSIFFILFISFSFFSCGKKKTENLRKQYSSNYERDAAKYEEQQNGTDSNSASLLGSSMGAAAGAAIGSFVAPGVGTAVGAGVGSIIGSNVQKNMGGFFGQNNLEEYINVETNFVFAQKGTENISTMVYGSTEDSGAKYFIPAFVIEKPAYLTIEMKTSLLNKAKGIQAASEEVLIPVEISINKSKNITITQTGGINGNTPEADILGNVKYSYYIKNNPDLRPKVVLKFTPAEEGEAKINIIYGKPDNKIVESTCDIFQVVEFVKNEEE